jgi:hypothetical protein
MPRVYGIRERRSYFLPLGGTVLELPPKPRRRWRFERVIPTNRQRAILSAVHVALYISIGIFSPPLAAFPLMRLMHLLWTPWSSMLAIKRVGATLPLARILSR